MLSDAQVERYARQIVLPEVGGCGQARLLASRAAVLGDGPASLHAADLLRRAGVQTSDANPAVIVDLRLDAPRALGAAVGPRVVGRLDGTRATLDALPRGGEVPEPPDARGRPDGAADPSRQACVLRALGALAASEALVLLLGARTGPRRTTIDLTCGQFTSGAPEAS